MSLISETKQKLEVQAREHGLIESPSGDSQKPQLKLPADHRQCSAFAREVGEIIGKTKALFRRDLTPVTVNAEKKRLDSMSSQSFITWAEKFIDFYKEKNTDGLTRRITKSMTQAVALAVLESGEFLEQLPEIRRMNPARHPVFRKNGAIQLLEPGFFEEQGIYTIGDDFEYDEAMTGEQGVAILRDLFKEYPLDPRSLGAQVAAMLTMFCASMLRRGDRPPSFIYTANSPRAGKTVLAMFPAIATTGSAAVRALPKGEEARKVLDGITMSGQSYAIFDNIRGRLQGEDIESFLTAPNWDSRELGGSKLSRVENNTVVFFTGNQLSNSKDMADRSLFIELLVREADPRDRKFSRIINVPFIADPIRRAQMCSAMWAMVKQWDADGRLPMDKLMSGFEGWSEIVPPIVKHAGFGDVLVKPKIHGVSDEVEDMRILITALAPKAGVTESKYEFEELMEKVKELGLFEDEELRAGRRDVDLFEKTGELTRSGRSFFGKLFTRYDGRAFVVGDRFFRFGYIGQGESRRYLITSIEADT